MSVIHIRKHLDSETLHLPELKPLLGKNVEIIVRDETPAWPGASPYEAFFALAGQNVVDLDAYKQLRAAAPIGSFRLELVVERDQPDADSSVSAFFDIDLSKGGRLCCNRRSG